MFHHEDPLDSWCNFNSPPPSVKSPNDEFTFDDVPHIEQPYPSPAESEPFDDDKYEQSSFDLNLQLAQPIQNSQDYDESHPLSDEISEVLCFSSDFDFTPMPLPMDAIKKEYEPNEKCDVLMHDIMLCHPHTIPMAMINTNVDSQDITYSVRPADITNTMSQIDNATNIHQESVQMETKMNYTDGSIEQQQQQQNKQVVVEHNYTAIPDNPQHSNSDCIWNEPDDLDLVDALAYTKTLSQPEKLSQRRQNVLPLKLQIPAENDTENQCHTADVITDVLDMAGEKFDLIDYIDQPEESKLPQSDKMPDVAQISNHNRPPSVMIKLEDLEAMIPTPSDTPMKRSRQCSVFSEDSYSTCDSPSTPKRRGRPPKTEATVLSPSVYKNLSDLDRKYLEMRNKNNEASRRSRQNRRGKETKVMTEAMKLEAKNTQLTVQFANLEREQKIWRRAVLRMARL